MTELTGKIDGLSIDFATGKAILTLLVNEKSAAMNCFDELNNTELTIKLSKFKKKRSLDSNAYMWTLCGKLAEKLCDTTKVKHTKEDIYRNAIREIGVFKDFQGLSPTDAKTLQTAWGMLGTGWLTEQVDFMPDGENVIIRCYYGSSTYNQKQMTRLIDNIVQDCQAVGIETKTPAELAEMLSLWGAER